MRGLILVGASHKSAPLPVRERLAVLDRARVYEALRAAGFSEAVVLSTCNRFEVYADGEDGSALRLVSLLEGLGGEGLGGALYAHAADRAARHLFEVAAGLDSLVVGETEILGQVRTAYEDARERGMTGKRLNVLFQRALFTGKKVRAETAIAVGQTSVASVAVQLAESIFGGLDESRVLVLGAGQMAELTARHLLSAKVAGLFIANRSWERAAALSERLRVSPVAWEAFPPLLCEADIVVASTASERPVLTREMVVAAGRRRGGRSLFLIDIAMPRDVEESVHGLEGVYLYRLEDLEGVVARNLESRGREVESARAIVARRAGEFSDWERSADAGAEKSLRHSPRLEPVPSLAGAREALP